MDLNKILSSKLLNLVLSLEAQYTGAPEPVRAGPAVNVFTDLKNSGMNPGNY